MNTKSALSLSFSLILLAFLSYYFAQTPQINILDERALSKLPDAIATNLTLMQFDTQGRLSNKLTTPRLTHFPKNDTHWFTMPKIQVQKENNMRWDISANRAKAIHGFKKITFMYNVLINQSDSKNPQPTTFKTEKLFYFPERQFAVSHAPVLFEQAGSQLTSTGMKAWLGKERIQLLSKTHAIYQPQQASS